MMSESQKQNINNIIKHQLENIENLLDKEYIIPKYQRPYTWEEEHVYKLLDTILENNSPYTYIGNIMLEENEGKFKIIDGQQRITTIALLLYCLGDMEFISRIHIESENEKEKLEQILKNNLEVEGIAEKIEKSNLSDNKKNNIINDLKSENVYKLNYYYIKKYLSNNKIYENKVNSMYKILNKTMVITITMKSGDFNISEIFDMINTTGKPLENEEKFKVRMYNYVIEDKEKTLDNLDILFKNVNNKRQEIKEFEDNKLLQMKKTYQYKDKDIYISTEKYDMKDILRLYKLFLIATKRKKDVKYSRRLFEMGEDKFYDRLFNYLSVAKTQEKTNQEYMNEEQKLFYTFLPDCVKLGDIQNLVKAMEKFKTFIMKRKWNSPDAYFAYKLFKQYNRYYWEYKYIPILYFYCFCDNLDNCEEFDEEFIKNFEKFIIDFSKICIKYSIIYSKKTLEIRNILNEKTLELLKNKKINFSEEELNTKKQELINVLNNKNNEVISNWYRKGILCLIIAYDAEKKELQENCKTQLMNKIELLFSACIDIEHIYAYNTNKKATQENKQLTQEEENGIGNLMILESSINRSIRDRDIDNLERDEKEKSKKTKIDSYKKSKFAIVKRFVDEFESVTQYLENIEKRAKDNSKIIEKYFEIGISD